MRAKYELSMGTETLVNHTLMEDHFRSAARHGGVVLAAAQEATRANFVCIEPTGAAELFIRVKEQEAIVAVTGLQAAGILRKENQGLRRFFAHILPFSSREVADGDRVILVEQNKRRGRIRNRGATLPPVAARIDCR